MAKKKQFHAKQITLSAFVVAFAFVVLVLLNQAMGSQLPLPSAHDLFGVLDTLYASAGVSTSPADIEGDVFVHYIDVGQADCALIQTPDQNILIDAGDLGGGSDIVDYLKSNGIKRLDMVIATHPHADHIGGMAEVIHAFDVKKVLFADLPKQLVPTTKVYENLLDTISSKGLKISRAKPGTQYDLGGGAVMTILAPLSAYDDLNNSSIICRMDFGECSFLFTGDAEKESESDLIKQYGSALSADVLKLGHHGSNTSSQQKWLNAVNPQIAIASVGYDNKYGHPHAEVLRSLDDRHTTLYRTDKNGSIVLATDGENLNVATEK